MMRFICAGVCAAVITGTTTTSAFTTSGKITHGFGGVPSTTTRRTPTRVSMAEDKIPFFAQADTSESPTAITDADSMTVEEEVEMLVQEEVRKTKRASNLRNENGVDYAPWMRITREDEEQIRQVMREKAEARRKRREQETDVSGNLYLDSQAQELSGAGLNWKVVGDDSIELEFGTKTETNTKGFIVKRRAAKTKDFKVIASYETWGPLLSKGADGGIYRYLDPDLEAGGYVYRISECDNNGVESDLCQCLVELQTPEEMRNVKIAAIGIGLLAVLAVTAGILADPMGGY